MDKIKSDDTVIEYDDSRVYIPIEVQDDNHMYLTREMIANGKKRLSFDNMLRED